MPILDYEGTPKADALWRTTNNTITTTVGCKRILDSMVTIKGVTDDYEAVAIAFGCVPPTAANGLAAFNNVNGMYAYLLNAYNLAIAFDKLQG